MLLKAKQKNIDGGALHEGNIRAGTSSLSNSTAHSGGTTAPSSSLGISSLGVLQLLHCLPCLFLVSSQFLNGLTLLSGQVPHKALESLNVCHMQIDLFLKHYQFLVHLDLQVVTSSLQLSLQLVHLFLLVLGQLLSLVLGILHAQVLHSFGLLHFKLLQFLPVVHGFFDAFIVRNKLLIVLHLL